MARVAVIGGGIAGSLAALALRGRGATPVIYDMGRRAGGRLGGAQFQFMRATVRGVFFFSPRL